MSNAMDSTPGNTTQVIYLTQLVADENFNARKSYDEKLVKGLAEDIKKVGQLNPMVVRPVEGKPGSYSLISGFTRLRALKTLAEERKDDAPTCIVTVVSPAEECGAHMMNLAENMLRANLHPSEIALKCAHISKAYGLSGAQIGSQLRRGGGYINNLLRILDKVHPDILDAWKAQNPKATVDLLLRIAGHEDKAEQLEMWNVALGLKPKSKEGNTDGDSDDGGDGDGEKNSKKEIKRASAGKLAEALAAIQKCAKSPEWKKGAIAALEFAIGTASKIPGVYDPDKKPEKADGKKGESKKAEGKK